MLFDQRVRRIAGRTSLGLVMLGAGAAALAASRPAAFAAAMGAVEKAITCNSASPCSVTTNSGTGLAISASSAKGTGIKGSGQAYGVQGTGTNKAGIYGTSVNGLVGVIGTTPNGYGVEGYTTAGSGGIGVYGSSPSGAGVFGTSTSGNGYGVLAQVEGGGIGVSSFSNTGYGLEGTTQEGYAVVAQAYDQGNGIYVATNSGYGLSTFTNGGLPIHANNSNGNGSDISGTYIGMIGRAPSAGGYPLVLTDQYGDNIFQVTGVGDVGYAGSLYQYARVKGGSIKSFSTKTTQATVEDTGTAELIGGVAQVRLDPTFAASIDARAGYRVFVTPGGETRGSLFVAAKSPSGFTVRETQAGRSNVTFDYRIVATAQGQAGQRMAFVSGNGARATVPAVQRLNVAKAKVSVKL